MSMQLNEVSPATRAIFADVRVVGRRVLDRFYEGFAAALQDVCPDWKHLKPRDRKAVFEKVQDAAKAVIVDVKDGGQAKHGLSLATFYGYVCKVKRAAVYGVPMSIAERATNQELQEAQYHVREKMKSEKGTHQSKMLRAYEFIKQRQVETRERLRHEAEAGATLQPTIAITTAATVLPDPVTYQSSEEDSDALLNTGITNMLKWLRSDAIQPHLAKKKLASAKVLKDVLAELTEYEKRVARGTKRELAIA